jgi:hypothetical protein
VVSLPNRQKLSARETALEVGRLCDHYGLKPDEAQDILFLAVQEGRLRAPRKGGRPNRYEPAAEYVRALAAGRDPGSPPPLPPLKKAQKPKGDDEWSLLKLLIDIEDEKQKARSSRRAPKVTERSIAEKWGMSYATFRRRKKKLLEQHGEAAAKLLKTLK